MSVTVAKWTIGEASETGCPPSDSSLGMRVFHHSSSRFAGERAISPSEARAPLPAGQRPTREHRFYQASSEAQATIIWVLCEVPEDFFIVRMCMFHVCDGAMLVTVFMTCPSSVYSTVVALTRTP